MNVLAVTIVLAVIFIALVFVIEGRDKWGDQ